MSELTTPETWCKLELLGHVSLAGRLSEEEKFGVKMGRLDIPSGDGFVTQFFGGASVYRITVCTEAVARQLASKISPAPISPWDYPKQQLAGIGHKDYDDERLAQRERDVEYEDEPEEDEQ